MSKSAPSGEQCGRLLAQMAGSLRKGQYTLPADAQTMAECLDLAAKALGHRPEKAQPEAKQATPATAASKSNSVVLMADGGSRGNPGPAGAGAVILDDHGNELLTRREFLGKTTNNIAEYHGLVMGLEAALELGARRITVKLDSELLVKQINGQYKVKAEHLKPLYAKAKALLQRFDDAHIIHIRRELNKRADELANLAMDSGR